MIRRVASVLACWLFALYVHLPSAAAAKAEVENGVLVMTEENFELAIKKYPAMLVKVYAPWCGHCKEMAPSFEKAAKKLKKAAPEVRLAKLDGTTDYGKTVGEKYGATGFPTLLAFKNGELATKYEGPREKDEFVEFMLALAGPDYLIQPRLMYIQTKFLFKMAMRQTPLGKGPRKFLYAAFPVLLVLLVMSPCLCWICCCRSAVPPPPSKKATAAPAAEPEKVDEPKAEEEKKNE